MESKSVTSYEGLLKGKKRFRDSDDDVGGPRIKGSLDSEEQAHKVHDMLTSDEETDSDGEEKIKADERLDVETEVIENVEADEENVEVGEETGDASEGNVKAGEDQNFDPFKIAANNNQPEPLNDGTNKERIATIDPGPPVPVISVRYASDE